MSEIVLTSEAAYILEVAAATVHDLERRGLLTAMRTARGVRLFRRADVERLAAVRRAAGKANTAENPTRPMSAATPTPQH